MKKLLAVIVLLLAGVAVGFYRGWFNFSTNGTDEKPGATVTVDKDKIHADEKKAKEKLQGLGQDVKDKTGDLTGKVKQ